MILGALSERARPDPHPALPTLPSQGFPALAMLPPPPLAARPPLPCALASPGSADVSSFHLLDAMLIGDLT